MSTSASANEARWSWTSSPRPTTLWVVGAVSLVIMVGSGVLMVTSADGAGPVFAFPAVIGLMGLLFAIAFTLSLERMCLDGSGVLELRRGLGSTERLDVRGSGAVVLARWRTYKTVHSEQGKSQRAIHHLAVLAAPEPGWPREDPASARIRLDRFPREQDDGLRLALEGFATVGVDDRDGD